MFSIASIILFMLIPFLCILNLTLLQIMQIDLSFAWLKYLEILLFAASVLVVLFLSSL